MQPHALTRRSDQGSWSREFYGPPRNRAPRNALTWGSLVKMGRRGDLSELARGFTCASI